jgi:hypothetical protein
MFSSTGSIRLGHAWLRRSRYRVIGLVVGISALGASNIRAQAQAQVNGPVAAFSFNEATGVTALDASSHGNDAELVNGPARTAGRFGGGVYLDGVVDSVQLPMTESLTFSNAFTMEAWIAPTAFDYERSLWWTPATGLTLRAEGTVVPIVFLSSGPVGFVSNRSVPLNGWSHVAMTFDGSMLRLYINGVDAGSRPAAGTLLPSLPEAGRLGGASAFAGTIDELRFYGRALTEAEVRLDSATSVDPAWPLEVSARTPSPNAVGVVQASVTTTFSRAVDASTITTSTFELVDSGNAVMPATVSYDAASRTATLSPTIALTASSSYTVRISGGTLGVRDAQGTPLAATVAWTFRTAAPASAPSAAYVFSETSGATASDSSGNGNEALVDATRTAGRTGGGLQMDGVDDGIQLPMTESLAFSSAFTFEAWISPAAFGRERNLWWTPATMLTLRAEGTVVPVAFLSSGPVGFVSDGVLPLDTWSHVAMTYDGSWLRLFINGADAGSRAASGTLVVASPPEPGIVGGASAFAGTIDELRFYRRALSAAEISADMMLAVNPAPTPLTVTAVTPAAQGVDPAHAIVSATFSRPAASASLTTATVQLLDSANHVVPAAVTYDAASRTVILTPTSPLAAASNYHARVAGGSGGVKAEDGGLLAADVQWSFVTSAAVPPPSGTVAPHISWLSTTSGQSGQLVVINGTHFGEYKGTNSVTFNDKKATIVYWCSSWIVVYVPSGATTGPLVVKVDGKASNAVTFTIPRRW